MKCMQFLQHKIVRIVPLVALLMMNGFSQSTLSVNVSEASVVVNKEIFGGLMERLGRCVSNGIWVGTGSSVANINGMRKDIIEGFIDCGIGALQYPGGCAANSYNWNPPNPSNDLGTDRFMQLCSLVTCTPIITGQAGSSQAASNLAWVTYINNNTSHPNWTVNYFQIGNEVWGACGTKYTGWAGYKPNYDANYDKLHTPVNGKQLYCIAGTDLIGNNQWLTDMVTDNPSRKDIIEIHDYIYFPKDINCLTFSDAQYYDLLNRSNESQIRPRLDGLVSILDKADGGSTGSRLRIWEGEWGCWLIPSDGGFLQYGTLMEGLSAGEHLNLFVRYARRMFGAGVAQVVNVIHSLMNTQSGTGPMIKTPTFYVFKMYIPHHTNNAKMAPTQLTSEKVNNINAVSAAATVNSLGQIHVSLTNIDLTAERKVTITLTGTTDDPSINWGQIVTGPAKNSYNDYGKTETVNLQSFPASNYSKTGTRTYSVTMPARSIVMLSFGGTAIQKGTIRKNANEKAFSIQCESNGRVSIASPLRRNTPVTVSLHSTDGRAVVSKVSKTLKAGNNALFMGRNIGKGVYMVTITGENINYTERIEVTR
jgi:alpha-L-arabinofuranosidase